MFIIKMPAFRVDKFSAGRTKSRSPISHVEKNMVEQSSTVLNSQSITYKEYLNHILGLTLSTPGLVFFLDQLFME